ncbi:hypothetical protein V9T40_001893 [Parthenolecanium corni]|uniref:Mitochondrial cardiolipin hydrolase n=1 Tax=Parthenolecanium corni TaxID=536013 RepID=A0AAN9Y4U3_9HEMI
MLKAVLNSVSSWLKSVSYYKQTCCLGLLTSTVFVVIYCSCTKNKKRPKPVRYVNEVIFFEDNNRYRNFDKRNHRSVENLKKLTDYLDSAKVSLNICVFTITSHKLGEVILKKFREGVNVRIITDDSMAYGDGSQIAKFRKEGIVVRARCSESLMHHKFAIVDDEILINGSFNWTEQATFGNWENVIITSVPVKMVESYVDHFNSLWIKLNTDS